jgi:hypothetical protein
MATLIGIELGRIINTMNVSSFLNPLFVGCVTFALAQVQLFLFGINGIRSILISFIFGALFFVLTFIAQLLLRMSNSIKKTERKLVDMIKDVDKRVAKRIVESQKQIQFEILNNQSEQATIILDDARREPEKQLAIAWSELGNYDCQIRNLEKKAAILTR